MKANSSPSGENDTGESKFSDFRASDRWKQRRRSEGQTARNTFQKH
jgi:hypothetical protein